MRAKAAWRVMAGVIPGQPIEEYTRTWTYTSEDYEEDGRHAKDAAYQPIMLKLMFEAMAYQMQMSDHRILNFSMLEWIWY
jgi:hypothetical protein